MNNEKIVRGYKAFNPDWTCSPNGNPKQYTCPGKFEEDVDLSVCNKGMHFCKKAADCFNYYDFCPDTKVAEVIAYGLVVEEGDKCCTDKLEIVREIPWHEVLEIVNTGKGCTGRCNGGDWNSGYRNSGDYNSGDCNSGHRNSGHWNGGGWNSGSNNNGTGNTGYCNSGNRNSGDYNSGDYNSGHYNSGNYNSGHYNSGNYNSGDWNKTNFSSGCFNTVEPKIYLFNKPSEWTYRDWVNSEARYLLGQIPSDRLKYVYSIQMMDEEKKEHPYAETTGGYLKKVCVSQADRANWWKSLNAEEKEIILNIPNFNKAIFKEITGIDVDA